MCVLSIFGAVHSIELLRLTGSFLTHFLVSYCELNIVMADDDSEPILGQWFEETLSPSESQSVNVASPSSVTGANDVDGVSSKHAHHHSSADSICTTTDKKEPDTV